MINLTAWNLRPGDQIKRTILHETFGGGGQGGIAPSAKSPNVLIFSDPASGHQHGYIDGWQDDGCFHYTGEGQRGDQLMRSGNAAILHHHEEKKALRVFDGTGGIVRYVDEFEVDAKQSFYTTDAPETGGGPIRTVIVFRLRPKTIAPPSIKGESPPIGPKVDFVPIEEHNTERAYVDPSREPYEAERRESLLVQRFKAFLVDKGKEVTRLRITPPGEAKPIFSDIYVQADRLLIEAKGTVERGAIRMALGQLLDYQRFIEGARCAILLPSRPRADLIKLIHSASVDLYIWEGESFILLKV